VTFSAFPKEGIRHILCDRIFVEADKMSHLGESVYYYQDQGLALQFWSLCDEICRYGGPGGIGYS